MNTKQVCAALLGAVLMPGFAFAELDNPYYSEFRNVETGLYMDVRQGVFTPGQRVWTWTGNTTDAQVFNPRPEDDTGLHMVYTRDSLPGPTLWLTIKEQNVGSIVVTDPGNAPEKYIITVDEEIELPTTPDGPAALAMTASAGLPMVPKPIHQQWRFEPVPGRINQYSIRPAAFRSKALTAGGTQNGSKLLVRDYDNSDAQHWHLEELGVDRPRGVMLEDFKYFPGGKLLGDINWQVNARLIDYFRIEAFSPDFGGLRSNKLPSSARSWEIDFEPGLDARDKEWCFRVEAVDERAGTNVINVSNEVCEVARRNAPQVTKYSKVIIENCHPDKINVRVWVSVDQGVFTDKGVLNSQYLNNNCPFTGSAKTINLEDGKFNEIVAMHSDCGSENPATAQGSCRVLNTPAIPGEESSTNVVRLQIGTGQGQ